MSLFFWLMLGFGFEVFAGEDVDAGFLFSRHQLTLEAGERTEALATYERLRTVLSAQLKIMPSPDTQAVYAGLLSQQSARAAPPE